VGLFLTLLFFSFHELHDTVVEECEKGFAEARGWLLTWSVVIFAYDS
jgi:hypothetical protein